MASAEGRWPRVATGAVLALAATMPASGSRPTAASIEGARQDDEPHRALLPLLIANISRLPAPPTAPPSAAPPTASAPTVSPPTAPAPTATVPTAAAPTGTAPVSTPTPTPTPTPTSAAACGAVPSFHDALSPSRTIWVTTGGDDGGDGSRERPFASIGRAVRQAAPGDAIRLAPGRYPGGAWIDSLAGTAAAPIWIGGDAALEAPVISGGGEGLHLARAKWVVVHDLVIENTSANGINADDGGDVADAAASHHVTFERLTLRDVGGDGNQDCLKLSGLRDVVVRDSAFRRCGGGGSGSAIDMVGVHRAVVARSDFAELSANAVQAKGGSTDIEVRANRMRAAGARAVNMGGSTGFAYFRPPLDAATPNAEARNVRVVSNWIEGSEAAVAFVGCVGCLAAHNTVVDPGRWVLRILQETRTAEGFTFEPSRDGVFANNIVVFRAGVLRTAVNVGDGTAPDTFAFRHNLWYASDAPDRSAPQLPVAESGAVIGRDPRLGPDGAIDALSPAARAGTPIDGIAGDLVGACYGRPPSIGAREVPESP